MSDFLTRLKQNILPTTAGSDRYLVTPIGE